MSESRFSVNRFFKDEDGAGGQFTVRGDTYEEFKNNWENMDAWLVMKGFGVWVKYVHSEPSNGTPNTSGEKFIPVESISFSGGGDHPRWMVKGGVFTKYGIVMWPEVLEPTGLNLDFEKENIPDGKWLAYYTEKMTDAGKPTPDKVVALVNEGDMITAEEVVDDDMTF